MSWLVLHQGALVTLATDTARVAAADVAPLTDALALLARAEAISAESQAAAEAEREKGYDDGFVQGLADGRLAANTEFVVAGAEHARATEAAIAALRADATRLALEVVRHIAGGFAPEAVLAGLADTALDRLAPGRVTLRAAPAQAHALARHLHARPDIRVLADPTLNRLDLVLETPQGRALAGLGPQLARVGQAWEVADAA